MRKHISYSEEIDGVEHELEFEPVGDTLLTQRVGDKMVIAYLVQDDTGMDIEDLMGDGCGKLLSFYRYGPKGDLQEGLAALGNDSDGSMSLEAVWEHYPVDATKRYIEAVLKKLNLDGVVSAMEGPDATYHFDRDEGDDDETFVRKSLAQDANDARGWACVIYDEEMKDVLTEMWHEPKYFPGDPHAQLLACYDHSGQFWSLRGQGMQCQWDTSNSAGVWVPDDEMRADLDKDPKLARKYAQSFLDEYNAIISGDVYGCVVQTNDADGKVEDSDSCWGFVGSEHAQESLKSEYFKPAIARAKKEVTE